MATARNNSMPSANGIYKSDMTQVYELAAKHNLSVVFDEPQMEASYKRTCSVTIRVGEFTAVGRARSKREAKARAATSILEHLKSLPLPHTITSTILEPVPCPMNEQGLVQVFREDNPCYCLWELVQARRMSYPHYRLLDSRCLAWGWLFTMRVTVEGLSAVETGPTKKAAKNNAAAKMLELLGVAPPQYNPLLKYNPIPPPQVDQVAEVNKVDAELLPPGVMEDGEVEVQEEICESLDVILEQEIFIGSDGEEEGRVIYVTSANTTAPITSHQESEGSNEPATAEVEGQEEVCEPPDFMVDEETTSENKITSPGADVLEDSTGPEVSLHLETAPAPDTVSLWDQSEGRPESPAGPETNSSQEEVKSLAQVNTGPETSSEETPSVLNKTISTKPKKTIVIEITLTSETTRYNVLSTSPSDPSTGPDNSRQTDETLSGPQTTSQSQPTSPPPILDGPPVASFLIRALVRKLVQKSSFFKHVDQMEAVTILEQETKDQIMVKDISIKDIRKVAKAAVKGLLKDVNLQGATLRAEDALFQEAVIKHLNNSLNNVLNEPQKKESGLSRFFSAAARLFLCS